jgi:putative transcriptional regulator
MGKTVTYTWDPNNPPTPTSEEWARIEAMTEEEIEAGARSDPDNPPLTDAQLARMERALSVRRIRAGTGLSQDGFAKRFGFSVGAVRDWEQGRRTPERAALAYLRVIQREPDAVMRALEAV